jgi:pimeloyl-ACP methyl ester carboxylesterase/uncharacterized protein YndB with AHSA1/START domain
MTHLPSPLTSGYLPVNGLEMYYEIHGEGRPLVLLHGGMSATETSFGALLPTLAATRRVIALEQQAHGRTADIDRPLRIDQMTDDTAGALRQLGIEGPDVLGYSMGTGIALELAMRYPELVRKVILISAAYEASGFHPGTREELANLRPEMLAGTPWAEEYARLAPRPDDFATMFAKVTDMNMNVRSWTAEEVAAVAAPMLLVIGDSDIVQPEHAVAMFRLRDGGVVGEVSGLPASQLAILPGTTHSSIVGRPDLLLPVIGAFLDAPMPGDAPVLKPFTITQRIGAARDRVFAAWTEPAAVAGWFAPADDWRTPLDKIQIDARPGGTWRVTMVDPSGAEWPAVFGYRAVDAPERLVFSTPTPDQDPADPSLPVATVTFTERDGGTDLTYEGYGAEGDMSEIGWRAMVGRIARQVESN